MPGDNLTWDQYLMGFARHAATGSKGDTQVGAVLVSPGRTIRLTGYNGPPRGVLDTAERRRRPTKYLFDCHAEQNLISFAARDGIRTEGCSVFVTHEPCCVCAGVLIQAGIVEIVYGNGTTSIPAADYEAAREKLSEAGVTVRKIGL